MALFSQLAPLLLPPLMHKEREFKLLGLKYRPVGKPDFKAVKVTLSPVTIF